MIKIDIQLPHVNGRKLVRNKTLFVMLPRDETQRKKEDMAKALDANSSLEAQVTRQGTIFQELESESKKQKE